MGRCFQCHVALILIHVLRVVDSVCALESVWSFVELLPWMLQLQNLGWQAWPCPVFTLQPIYPGKDWHVFTDGLGKVFRLFLQPQAHNQVFMLFLGDVCCQSSLLGNSVVAHAKNSKSCLSTSLNEL